MTPSEFEVAIGTPEKWFAFIVLRASFKVISRDSKKLTLQTHYNQVQESPFEIKVAYSIPVESLFVIILLRVVE